MSASAVGEMSQGPGSLRDMTSPRQLVSAYWAAAEARDWAAFGRLLAEDVRYEAPMSHERVSGKPAYLRFNAEGFPGDWHLSVQRIVADEGTAASWIQMTDAGETYPGLAFFEIADGLIVSITDFWPEAYEPPASRAHLTERI
jgi:SnoaL-like domain